jgi:hypothetical protein
VIFYGLADHSLEEIVELYVSREEAERTLREVLRDEPLVPARSCGGSCRT